MTLYVVFGSWKLRHNEPISNVDKELILYPIKKLVNIEAHCVLLDLEEDLDKEDFISLDETGQLYGNTDDNKGLPNWLVPLALVKKHKENLQMTHALLRIDLGIVQLMETKINSKTNEPLWQTIYRFNEDKHLFFSNHECFYIKDNETNELEQKYNFKSDFSYLNIMQKIYAAVQEGRFPKFRPKYGDEFQFWSFNNYLYEINPNDEGVKGYVSMINYCKKKSNWDDPMYMYKKKIYEDDSLERWERNYENQWVEGDKQQCLEQYFSYKISPFPAWRRTRCDIGVESIDSGNVFMVNMDDCRVIGGELPIGRLQQCEIEYMSTNGIPDRESIYREFHTLANYVLALLEELNLQPIKTYYSKLTFLRDYMAEENHV